MTDPKILIIDDNPSDRTLALRELKKLFPHFQAVEISDEAGFTEALQTENFNIVITDYQLRWITGIEILHRLKKKKPDCPVVMFTGTGNEEIAVEAMKAGLDDYVVKSPKHYVRLAAAVRSAWQRSQQSKALEEFKQSYYRFFERIPLGLYRLNPSGEIIEANSTLVKMLGYDRREDLQGKSIFKYHVKPEAYLLWQQQLNSDRPQAELETQIQTVAGRLIWIRHNAIAVEDAKGDLICYEGAVADITSNKQAEIERSELLNRERKAKEEAETVNRIKDEFLATLSHELRTPLNAIIGWIQLLRGGKMSDSQINKALDVIDRNAKAQNQLIDDLLDVSRIIRGTMKLQLQPTNLMEVMMASLDTVRPGAEAKNIEIVTQFEFDSTRVNADKERLQQVFWNLLINAIKFTPAGGKVTIRSEVQGNTVLVKIKDTGQGIAADILPYVFDRFRQAESKSSTRTQGGLGLGLAIVRHLVEIHGGRVMAGSEGLGTGATFAIELPILPSANNDEIQITESATASSLPSLVGLTLLVVEDEADAREMVTLILEQCGAKIVAADSVKQALIEYERQQPDILISDISMPSEDGYALIRQIRNSQNDKSKIPAIALTAYAREKDKQEALEAGFDLHLPKPIRPMRLVESLAQLLHRAKQT